MESHVFCLRAYSNSISIKLLIFFIFLGRRRAGWGRWTGSGPANPWGSSRWSAGGAGWILTAVAPHHCCTPIFNMWELFKDFNFSSWFYFLSSPRLSTWSNLLNRSTITVFIFCIPLLTVRCFFVTFGELLWQTSSDHRRSFWGLCWRKVYSKPTVDLMTCWRQVPYLSVQLLTFPAPALFFHFVLIYFAYQQY